MGITVFELTRIDESVFDGIIFNLNSNKQHKQKISGSVKIKETDNAEIINLKFEEALDEIVRFAVANNHKEIVKITISISDFYANDLIENTKTAKIKAYVI